MTIARRIETVVAVPGEVPFESNIIVREMETRPDWQAPSASSNVFVLRDLWPQVNGSADSWPQWARDAYLKPWGDPCGNDSAGGETHLFAVAIGSDEQCGVIHGKTFAAWTDGFEKIGDPVYSGYVGKTADRPHGWVNWFDSNGYYPDQGQRGPWCWMPNGIADVVDGGGLPYNRHVSWFAVWERMTYGEYVEEKGEVTPVIPGEIPLAAIRLAVELSTRVKHMESMGDGVRYYYMTPNEVVEAAVAIERGLAAAYEE